MTGEMPKPVLAYLIFLSVILLGITGLSGQIFIHTGSKISQINTNIISTPEKATTELEIEKLLDKINKLSDEIRKVTVTLKEQAGKIINNLSRTGLDLKAHFNELKQFTANEARLVEVNSLESSLSEKLNKEIATCDRIYAEVPVIEHLIKKLEYEVLTFGPKKHITSFYDNLDKMLLPVNSAYLSLPELTIQWNSSGRKAKSKKLAFSEYLACSDDAQSNPIFDSAPNYKDFAQIKLVGYANSEGTLISGDQPMYGLATFENQLVVDNSLPSFELVANQII